MALVIIAVTTFGFIGTPFAAFALAGLLIRRRETSYLPPVAVSAAWQRSVYARYGVDGRMMERRDDLRIVWFQHF